MTSPDYILVYDVGAAGYCWWWFPCFGLVLTAIFGVVLFHEKRSGRLASLGKWERIIRWFGLVFSIGWTSIAFAGTLGDYLILRGALRNGRCEVVEGAVTDFVPMPHEGHVDERFKVGTQCFAYSDFGVTAGFNNTLSYGGPIRSGLKVRIHHLHGEIARLEMLRSRAADR